MNQPSSPKHDFGPVAKGVAIAFAALIGLAILLRLVPDRAAPASPEPRRPPAVEFREMGINNNAFGSYVFVVPAGSTPADLEAQARRQCREKQMCFAFGFATADAVPGALPMTEREEAALRFHYGLNRQTGLDQSTWDCSVWPAPDDKCNSR